MRGGLLHLQLRALQRIMQPALDRERAEQSAALLEAEVRAAGGSSRAAKRASKGMLSKHRRPPSRSRPIIAATASQPARVADEPRMAVAFALRRLDGMGYDRAASETAAEFRAIGKARRPGIAVERAWARWRDVVLPELIAQLPGHAERLREFLREPRL